MTLNEIDRKELVGVVGEALEEYVLPRLSALEDGQKKLEDGQTGLKNRLLIIEEKLDDHGEQLNQINRKLDATIAVNDRHDRRLTRVEKHLGLPVLEPVTPAA